MPSGQLLAHGDADRLEDLAALADDDGLLRVALDDDFDADVRPLPLGHPAGDGVRQLVPGLGQQLLAHQLGHPERLGRVGDDVGREEGRALRRAGRSGGPSTPSTPLPVRAETGKYSTSASSSGPASASTAALAWVRRSITWALLALSTLFTTTIRPGGLDVSSSSSSIVVVSVGSSSRRSSGLSSGCGCRGTVSVHAGPRCGGDALDLAHRPLQHCPVTRPDGRRPVDDRP